MKPPPVKCRTEDEKSARCQNDNGSSDEVVELKILSLDFGVAMLIIRRLELKPFELRGKAPQPQVPRKT